MYVIPCPENTRNADCRISPVHATYLNRLICLDLIACWRNSKTVECLAPSALLPSCAFCPLHPNINVNTLEQPFPNFSLRGALLASKNNHGSYILADVIIVCPDGRHPKLETSISELMLDRHQYIPTVTVTLHCVI